MTFTCNGFGTGALGNITISSTLGAGCHVNSYAAVSAISSDGMVLTINPSNMLASQMFGFGFTAGQELFFHVTGCLGTATADMGKYAFRRIKSMSGNTIVLSQTIGDVFPVGNLSDYAVQILSVPQFMSLQVTNGAQVPALAWDDTKKIGGLVVMKVRNMMDIANGKIIGQSKGLPRSRRLSATLSNSDVLMGKLPMSAGGGCVFISAYNVIMSANTRFGGLHDGNLGAGAPGTYESGYAGQAGIVGRGGDGADGQGADTFSGRFCGGIVGMMGDDGTNQTTYGYGGEAGSSVFLAANLIQSFSLSAFSTGGLGGGHGNAGSNGGPGGAGFGGAGGSTLNNNAGSGGGPGVGAIATNAPSFPTNTIAYALDTLNIIPERIPQSYIAIGV